MISKDEALKMAIEVFDMYGNKLNSAFADEAYQACKQALEQPVAELNNEYLRDTYVEGLSTNSKANEIIKTQHLYNLVEILNDPMKAYPHNFSTPAKGNALLLGLCQEAADEIEHLKAETQEPVAWMNDIAFSMDKDELTTDKFGDIVPLYTHPKEWQGLTDDEISKLWCTDHASYLEFAHSIEQALKDKNHE